MSRAAIVASFVLALGFASGARAQDDADEAPATEPAEAETPEAAGDEATQADAAETDAEDAPEGAETEPAETAEPTETAPVEETAPIEETAPAEEPADTAAEDGVELDEWGLPIEEDAEPEAPPPPYGTRLGYEVLGVAVGALSLAAIGFGIGTATAGITNEERTLDEIMLGGVLGIAIATPFGAALGVYLAGEANGGTGTPAGAILGALAGASIGVVLGLSLGYGLAEDEDEMNPRGDSFTIGAAVGGATGAALSVLGAVIGYEITSGPHPEPEGEDGTAWVPILAPLEGGALAGAAGRF